MTRRACLASVALGGSAGPAPDRLDRIIAEYREANRDADSRLGRPEAVDDATYDRISGRAARAEDAIIRAIRRIHPGDGPALVVRGGSAWVVAPHPENDAFTRITVLIEIPLGRVIGL